MPLLVGRGVAAGFADGLGVRVPLLPLFFPLPLLDLPLFGLVGGGVGERVGGGVGRGVGDGAKAKDDYEPEETQSNTVEVRDYLLGGLVVGMGVGEFVGKYDLENKLRCGIVGQRNEQNISFKDAGCPYGKYVGEAVGCVDSTDTPESENEPPSTVAF